MSNWASHVKGVLLLADQGFTPRVSFATRAGKSADIFCAGGDVVSTGGDPQREFAEDNGPRGDLGICPVVRFIISGQAV